MMPGPSDPILEDIATRLGEISANLRRLVEALERVEGRLGAPAPPRPDEIDPFLVGSGGYRKENK